MISVGSRAIGTVLSVWLLSVGVSARQAPAPTAEPVKPDVGIPITSPVVRQACGSCHASDDKGQMSRISFRRTTPEGWEFTIRRMVSLNNVKIEPQTAREVVKYLSDNLGLAPEEAKPAAFHVERRLIDWKYSDAETEDTCNRCHSLGRVISQRRTKSEWELLMAMHRGWYPLVNFQAFRREGPPPPNPGPDGRPADMRHPMDKAVDHLSKTFPLVTPEWTTWSNSMRAARLEGTWALSGWEPGKGAVVGRVTITPVAGASDDFTTAIAMTYARTGVSVARTGRVTIYTGFQWRGRSMQGADDKTSLREVMAVERDWQHIEGRWFTGAYDELGLDVRLDRLGRETTILGTSRLGLRSGGAGQALTIYGANLPATLTPADVDLGPGVTIARIVNSTAEAVTLSVDVTAGALTGSRDIFVAGARRPRALMLYDRIDAIKLTPEWSMARVGGSAFAKGFAQFEAWGYQRGPDNKVGTADDIKVDVVPATWSLEEYAAIYGDEDIKFVGDIDKTTGLFTPNIEGPNPKRVGSRNNIGDVWVVATLAPEPASAPAAPAATAAPAASGQPASLTPALLRARAHLLVTVPLYIQWGAFESQPK